MKRFFSLTLLAVVALLSFARPQSREVVIDTICNAPIEKMLAVTDSFCYQFQACPDSLFKWAYLGLGEEEVQVAKTKESRDAIQLGYKDRTYDPKTQTGDVTIDIYVLGVRWWKDQHLGTKSKLTHPEGAPYPLTKHMTATYSGSILEGGDFIMRLEPMSDNRTRVHYEFRLVFGKVLSIFISDKTWQNAIKWRFDTILENLVECAETGTVQPKDRGPHAQ